ncbi:MAG: S8/S53 family peptidase [Ferruginibacter sp.]
MKLFHPFCNAGIIFFLFASSLIMSQLFTSCKPTNSPNVTGYLTPDTSTYVEKISWNVLFKENVSQPKKEKIINQIKDSVILFYTRYNHAYGTRFIPVFDSTYWCPCDSTLYNLNFHSIIPSPNGAGQSVSSPPPGKGLGGQGDLVDVLYVSDNVVISEPFNKENATSPLQHNAIKIDDKPIDGNKILSIIDSGLDTSLFTSSVKKLIWRDQISTKTLFNFLPGQPVKDFNDAGAVKHGSAVTAIALDAMRQATAYPQVMILKALDNKDQGSIFSVSCALSYAIQKKATVVNLSLGYLGKADSIMRHYIALSNKNDLNPLQLFVAAGNTPYPHKDSLLCSSAFANNLLINNQLFYPACFSKSFNNLTSVTQIRLPDSYCYYQYYSNDYITLGVLNNETCCSFKVNFRTSAPQFYEGSSFATPFASGLKMMTILNQSLPGLANINWNNLLQTEVTKRVTRDGKYIVHQR